MSKYLRVLSLPCMVLTLTAVCAADGLVYLRIHRPVIEERLQLTPQSRYSRVNTLRTLFKKAGCTEQQISEQKVPHEDLPNVICTLPGTEEGTIVVGAPAGYGGEGNEGQIGWSDLVMLPLMAESVNSAPHRYTFVFAAFAGNENETPGAAYFLGHLSKSQRTSLQAMIGLAAVGKSPIAYKLAQQDRAMALWLEMAASMVRLPYIPADAGRTENEQRAQVWQFSAQPGPKTQLVPASLGSAKPFGKARVPAIGILSSSSAPSKALDFQTYEDTYRLLCIYLLALDRNIGKQPTVAPGGDVARSATAIAATSGSSATSGTTTQSAPNATATPAQVASNTNPNPTMPPHPIPVFRAKSQLVLVDVTVRDKQGHPVKDLKDTDFTIFEDGKPQAVRVFESHALSAVLQPPPSTSQPVPTASVQPTNSATAPAGSRTYTNKSAAASNDTLSILLLDVLNTPAQDQMRARSEMLKFLRSVPANSRLALFVLGTQVRVISGFTQNSAALAKAAEKTMVEVSPLLTTQADREQATGDIEYMGGIARPGNGMTGQGADAIKAALNDADTRNVGMDVGHVTSNKKADANTDAHRLVARMNMTLDAMNAIARAVSVYTGRKNMLWLSGAFPMLARPQTATLTDPLRKQAVDNSASGMTASEDYQKRVRDTMTLLSQARVAVYPIDVRGIQVGGLAISNSAGDSLVINSASNKSSFARVLNSEGDTRFQDRNTMNDVAEQTGGEVFADNDIRHAIVASIDDGSTYYTLAYTPPSNDESIEAYRRIEVKSSREDVKLAYRRGYYTKPKQEAVAANPFHALAASMQPDSPVSTMLVITAQVAPPDGVHEQTQIDYHIDLGGIEFADATEQRRQALVDCMAVAFDKDGKDVAHVANTISVAVNPAEYEAMVQKGIPMHQELALPPGTYQIRIGVMDRLSQKVGTLDAPVVVAGPKAAQN